MADQSRERKTSQQKRSGYKAWEEMDRLGLPEKAPQPISALAPQFKERIRHLLGISEEESVIHSIQKQWSTLAGLLANHSQPLEIRSEKLLVSVSESVYAQELQLHSRDIRRNIEKTLGMKLKGIQIVREGFRK